MQQHPDYSDAQLKQQLTNLVKTTLEQDLDFEEGKAWGYHPQRRTITYPRDGAGGLETTPKRSLLGSLYHEIAHATYSSDLNAVEIIDFREEYQTLLHALEDIRVEKKLQKRFPGVADNFKAAVSCSQYHHSDEALAEMPAHLNVLSNVKRFYSMQKLLFSSARAADFFYRNILRIDKLVGCETTEELTGGVTHEIWPAYKKLIAIYSGRQNGSDDYAGRDNDLHQDKAPSQDGCDPDDCEQCDNSHAQDSPQQNDDQDLIPQNQQSECQNFAIEAEDFSIEQGIAMSLSMEENDSALEQEARFSFSNAGISTGEGDKQKTAQYRLPENAQQSGEEQADDKEDKSSRDHLRQNGRLLCYEDIFTTELQEQKKLFVKKLGSILHDNNNERIGGAFSEGTLNSTLLYRFRCNSDRVFSRKLLRSHKHYNISLLIDESSSMRGERIIHTAQAAALLCEVLQSVNLSFQVIGFNSDIRIYKRFQEKLDARVRRRMEEIIPAAEHWNAGYTNDAGAITISSHLTRNQPDGENIILILTDGRSNLPSKRIPLQYRSFFPKNCETYRHLTASAEIRKVMTDSLVIGIGIDYDEVRENYPVSIVNREIDKLSVQVLNLLQKYIVRG